MVVYTSTSTLRFDETSKWQTAPPSKVIGGLSYVIRPSYDL